MMDETSPGSYAGASHLAGASLPSSSDVLCAALWYAQQGLRVLPLRPGLKVPAYGVRGYKDASSDPVQIRAWWQRMPKSNLGIATGHLVDVIDLDGPDAVRTWLSLDERPQFLGRVRTPRPGGYHLYVYATGDGIATGLLPGIDYRGVGGYVVAPPSWFGGDESHTYQGNYTWVNMLTLGQGGADDANMG